MQFSVFVWTFQVEELCGRGFADDLFGSPFTELSSFRCDRAQLATSRVHPDASRSEGALAHSETETGSKATKQPQIGCTPARQVRQVSGFPRRTVAIVRSTCTCNWSRVVFQRGDPGFQWGDSWASKVFAGVQEGCSSGAWPPWFPDAGGGSQVVILKKKLEMELHSTKCQTKGLCTIHGLFDLALMLPRSLLVFILM